MGNAHVGVAARGCLVALLCLGAVRWSQAEVTPSLTERDIDNDGHVDEVVLENRFLAAVFVPARGGLCKSLIYRKTGKQLTKPGADGFGLFLDQEWSRADWPSPYQRATYTYRVEKRTAEECAISFSARGQTPETFFLEITKTFTVFHDRNGIRVDYRVRNVPDSQVALRYRGWIHNVLDVQGEDETYFVPSRSGVITERGGIHPDRADRWYRDPSRGWSAVLSRSGTGAAAVVDYRYLKLWYNWFAGEEGTLEWRYMPVDIPPGEVFSTSFWLLPFSGLDSVDGASPRLVGSLDLPDHVDAPGRMQVPIRIYSAAAHEAVLTLECRKLPGKGWKKLASRRVSMIPDEVTVLSMEFIPDSDGTYVLRASAAADGELLGRFERPVVVGSPSASYVMEAVGSRVDDLDEKERGRAVSLEVSPGVVTPHIPWARPYALGQVRALFLVELWGHREVVELAQRMDLDYRVPTLHSTGDVVHGPGTPWRPIIGSREGFAQAERALDAPGDVVIIADSYSPRLRRVTFDWGRFTKGTWRKLLQQVEAGCGLVIVDPYEPTNWKGMSDEMRAVLSRDLLQPAGPNHFVTLGVPFDVLKGVGVGSVRIGAYGKGRIVLLDYPALRLTPAVSLHDHTFRAWEYYYSLLAKSVVWAARKEPRGFRLSSLSASAGVDGPELTLSFANGRKDARLSIAVNVMDERDDVESTLAETLDVPAGDSEHHLRLTGELKRGLHFVNVIVRDDEGRSIVWGTALLRMKTETHIADVILDKDTYASDDIVRCSIRLAGNPQAARDLRLVAELVDNCGRLHATATKDVGGAQRLTVALPLARPLTLVQRVRCTLFSGSRTLDRRVTWFCVPEVGALREPFYSKVWLRDGYDCDSYLAAQRIKRLKDLGFDIMNGGDARWWTDRKARLRVEANARVALENMLSDLPVRIGHRERYQAVKKDNIRRRCFSDPAYLADLKGRIQSIVRKVVRYNPDLYSLEDEPGEGLAALDICYSPHCLKRFREWLKREYGSLEALNAEWETAFVRWEDVRPMTRTEVRGRSNYAPWADHHAFMDTVYAETLGLCRRWIQEIDPSAYVGVSGIQPAPCHYGFWGDWWKLMQEMTMLDPYERNGLEAEIVKSFAPRSKVSRCIGYGRNEVLINYDAWTMFLAGQDGIAYWYGPYAIAPDLTETYHGRVIRQIIAELCHGGLGELRALAERQVDPIGIHYSEASARRAFVTGNDRLFLANLFKWHKALKDLGLQPGYVSYEQIERGELTKGRYRVLILPWSSALSDAEARAIEEFVRQGGLVIADVEVGVSDSHGKPRATGALDEMFGIRRARSRISHRVQKVLVSGSSGGFTVSADKISAGGIEEGLVASEAAPLGTNRPRMREFGGLRFGHVSRRRPLVMVRRCGKGLTVYLGFLGSSLMYEGKAGSLLEELLGRAGVSPALVVRNKAGERLYGYHVTCFRDGSAQYLGIVPDIMLAEGINLNLATPGDMAGKARDVVVVLEDAAHLYDVRRKRYLGFGDRLSLRAIPGVAEFYAVLPGRIEGLTVTGAKENYARGEVVSIRGEVVASEGWQGNYVVKAEVHDPEGARVPYYSRCLTAARGEFGVDFPLALNEKRGSWRVVFTEVVSGTNVETQFTVE